MSDLTLTRSSLIARDAERAEDAVKYIIFLSDANKLFDLALGMYDFALVLMIAQHSQKVSHGSLVWQVVTWG